MSDVWESKFDALYYLTDPVKGIQSLTVCYGGPCIFVYYISD